MKITNKDVIQSYLLTTAKYDFSAYEKRILYRLVEMIQWTLEGKKLNGGFRIEKTLFNDRIITMPVNAFLKGENDENYSIVKQALRSLRNKTIEYEDAKIWKLIGIIEKPEFNKAGFVTFELQPEIYEAILNFSKGFRKYELETAMSFESQYSMRFYELFSGQKSPLIYTIESLKIMFKIEGKYKGRPSDFIKYVVTPAKKELDKKSPYSFEFSQIKTGREITAIKFFPVYNPEARDPELEKRELQKQISLSWDFDPMLRNYLKQDLLFTTDEIKNNVELFRSCYERMDLMYELSILKGKARTKKNPKGYIINALKGKLKD